MLDVVDYVRIGVASISEECALSEFVADVAFGLALWSFDWQLVQDLSSKVVYIEAEWATAGPVP